MVAEVSLVQSAMVPGYPASGLPLVILGAGEPPDAGDELPMMSLPVALAGAIGRALLEIVREVRP